MTGTRNPRQNRGYVVGVFDAVIAVVRGSLSLPASLLPTHYSLLSIAGRKVLALHPGANDVSRLNAGVHFLSEEPQASSRRLQAVQKIVITR